MILLSESTKISNFKGEKTMIKYSTPSIEVVNFSSSDAPRIGMQWWYSNQPGQYAPAPASYTGVVDVLRSYEGDYTNETNGLNHCAQVTVYVCWPETGLPADAVESGEQRYVADDHRSC